MTLYRQPHFMCSTVFPIYRCTCPTEKFEAAQAAAKAAAPKPPKLSKRKAESVVIDMAEEQGGPSERCVIF